MKRILFCQLATLSLMIIFISCRSHEINTKRAFYYWKNSKYSLTQDELLCLQKNEIQKLYVKFFEVDLDPLLGAVPTVKTELHLHNYSNNKDSLLTHTMNRLEIIPTVYVKNKALYSASQGSLDTLSDNIVFLINRYYKRQFNHTSNGLKEIQVDCDWTEKTKDNYFYLLKKIKWISRKTISCTLRLYPYKYPDKMGVPPVDNAVLMCYNLINPLAREDENSILSNQELEKYLSGAQPYPVPLDFALPVFTWMQVYQNNQFAGIINPNANELDTILKPIKPLWYEVTDDIEIENLYLRTGDKIKFEDVTTNTIKETIRLLKKHVEMGSDATIILFHLDGNNLKKFDHETLSGFFTDFNR